MGDGGDEDEPFAVRLEGEPTLPSHIAFTATSTSQVDAFHAAALAAAAATTELRENDRTASTTTPRSCSIRMVITSRPSFTARAPRPTAALDRYPRPVPRAVVISGVRTPIGRYGGALAHVRPDDLAALAIDAAVQRSGVDASAIDDVYLGCANQAGEDNRNVARMAVLLAGLPDSVPGVTLNRLCASGLSAVVSACHAVGAGG